MQRPAETPSDATGRDRTNADPSTTTAARLGQWVAVGLFLLVLAVPWPADLPPAARRTVAVAALMATLWLTQALPLAATSLIPVAAFPLLGILPAEQTCKAYITSSVMLYLGGFVLALGIERWGLHRRMALHVVRAVGCGPRRLVLGFAVATAGLSMWVSNTASALLMLPIAAALITSLEEISAGTPEGRRPLAKLATALLLAIAYSASIGGMTTLVGTPTNLAFRQIYLDIVPNAVEVSAGEWMTAFVPLGVAMLLAMWLVLTWRLRPVPGTESLGRAFFSDRLKALGPPSRAECSMFALFAATAALWLFRTPISLGGQGATPLVPGWGPVAAQWLEGLGLTATAAGKMIDDSTVALAVTVLMFALPAGRRSRAGDEEVAPGVARNLMDWPTAVRLPWDVLLLFGGGFALAEAFQASDLSRWCGERFETAFAGQPVWLLVGGTCLILTFLTEFTSNTATCNILLPILAAAAAAMGIDARLLMVPAALSASCAFMLPVATPPNAIIFGSGRVSVAAMTRAGLALNLIGVVLVTLATLFIYAPQAGIRW